MKFRYFSARHNSRNTLKKNIFQCFSHLKQTHSSASFRYTDAILVARKECLKDLTDYIGLRFERVTFALLTVNELDI